MWEVTSQSTKREDESFKPQSYARIGVKEYFLYDPTGEYLAPPLVGFRLQDGDYIWIEPDDSGVVLCQELGILLHMEADKLLLTDSQTGDRLLTEAEAASAEAEAANARAQSAEEELRQLRAQLKRGDVEGA